MLYNQNIDNYHGYEIRSQVVPSTGDFTEWVAEVSWGEKSSFHLRLKVTRFIQAHSKILKENIESEGLKRVHARIDFGMFHSGEVYDHKLTSSDEILSHPINEKFKDLFSSLDERLTFHTLSNLQRLAKESPSHRSGDKFDLFGWSYLLNISDPDLWPVFRNLEGRKAIKVFWEPSPSSYGTFEPDGYLELLTIGDQLLNQLEINLIQRRRDNVMPDIEEDAFQIARFLFDNRYIRSQMILVRDLKQQVGLSEASFDTAEDYLLEARYCSGTMGGENGFRYLTANGVDFVKSKLDKRMKLSAGAERLARYIAEQVTLGKSSISIDQAANDLRIRSEMLVRFAEELVDENLATDVSATGAAQYSIISLSPMGRRSVRRNFSHDPEVRAFVDGDYVQGDKIGGDKVTAGDILESNVAMGRQSQVIQGMAGDEITNLFSSIFDYINRKDDLSDEDKKEAIEIVELIEDEVEKGKDINERALSRFIKDIAKMGPDILEVIITTTTAFFTNNPTLAVFGVLKKIAEKVKTETAT